MRPVNLSIAVENLAKMIRRVIGEDISLELRTKPVKNVLADAGQIEQALMNLVLNARDAMPEGGSLIIAARNELLDRKYSGAREGLKPGIYAMLSVTDSGKGMPAEVKDKIFEPFFTTKGDGKSSGLGLSTVYGIVKQHNGHISVESDPGAGTTFNIYLPVTDELVADAKDVFPVPLAGGHETVLVVDDDPSIVAMITDALVPLGYSVLSATTSGKALDVGRLHEKKVDLLLTDVIMPSMNGRQLSDEIRKKHSHMKTIFMSGYADNVIARSGVLEPGIALLQKPLTRRSLAKKIRDVMDGQD